MRQIAVILLFVCACEVQETSLAEFGADAASVDVAQDAAPPPIDAPTAQDVAEPPSVPFRGTLFVVTTRQIAADSKVLAGYLDHKGALGFEAVLVTEDHYGSDGATGHERAVAIREWLAGSVPLVEDGPVYALLVGDAHALYGDVPMFTVWPRHTYSPTTCLGAFALDCRSFESDMPYADLSGDWDQNGDGLWGEHGLDDGPGGLDFEAEALVGRIPVYFGETGPLDQILSRAMAYEAEPPEERAWRDRLLLAASFYYFEGQAMQSYTVPDTIDGAETPEWFVANVLPDHPGVSTTRLYEQEGVVASAYPSELPLTEPGLLDEWSKGYGAVWWFGHGLERSVVRTVWVTDDDGDLLADNSELSAPPLITSQGAATLPAGHPAFVVAVICEVGSAETPNNLAYALLLSGGAVGVVGSTNLTPTDTTDYGDPGSQLDTEGYGATNMGVWFLDALLAGEVASKALFDTKVELGLSGSIESYAGRMMLNYLGDPTRRLREPAP